MDTCRTVLTHLYQDISFVADHLQYAPACEMMTVSRRMLVNALKSEIWTSCRFIVAKCHCQHNILFQRAIKEISQGYANDLTHCAIPVKTKIRLLQENAMVNHLYILNICFGIERAISFRNKYRGWLRLTGYPLARDGLTVDSVAKVALILL